MIVVEAILHLKCQLESDNTSVEEKLLALRELKAKNPSKNVLLSTGIGRTVNSLRRHENQDICSLAKDIFRKWKQFITKEESIRPVIEVQCDNRTTVLRNKAKEFLANALDLRVSSAFLFVLTLQNYSSSLFRTDSHKFSFPTLVPEVFFHCEEMGD